MQLYNSSADKAGAGSAFVAEMHPIVEAFHRCQCATTPTGSGCCRGSGARSPGSTTAFGDHATVANHSAAISCDDRHSFGSCGTYDFWSIDINAYLYREKLVLARMASLLGNNTGAAHWTADASQLLPRLRDMFYVQDDGDSARGFFHDRCFNQTVVRRLHGAVLRGGDPGPGGRHDQSAVGPEPVPAHLLAAVLVPGQRALLSDRVLARPRLARPDLVRHRGLRRYGFHDLANVIKPRVFCRVRGATHLFASFYHTGVADLHLPGLPSVLLGGDLSPLQRRCTCILPRHAFTPAWSWVFDVTIAE